MKRTPKPWRNRLIFAVLARAGVCTLRDAYVRVGGHRRTTTAALRTIADTAAKDGLLIMESGRIRESVRLRLTARGLWAIARLMRNPRRLEPIIAALRNVQPAKQSAKRAKKPVSPPSTGSGFRSPSGPPKPAFDAYAGLKAFQERQARLTAVASPQTAKPTAEQRQVDEQYWRTVCVICSADRLLGKPYLAHRDWTECRALMQPPKAG